MLSDTKKRIFGRLQNFLKTSKFAQCETWWNQLCSYCALHVNCGFISNQAMCATQFEKDQKDALLHFLLAGFHVKWFHHPSWSWPNCWQKLRQPYWIYWDVLDQHEAGFRMTSAHAMPGEQSLTKPSHLSYLYSFPGCDYFPNYMQLPTFLSTS